MKLLIDIGNTRLKWAWLEDGTLRDPGAIRHGGSVPQQAIGGICSAGRRAGEILVASVAAPALTGAIVTLLEETLAARARIAQTEAAAAGVRNGYVEPRQLGVDRWLAMLAAFARFRSAVCVIDAGTALTVDAVGRDGCHLGGLIVPGPALMRSALLEATGSIGGAAALAPVQHEQASAGWAAAWGRDTESCIRLGSLRAIDRLADGCMRALAGAGEPGGVLVLTGGDAPALMDGLSLPAEHLPLLVLEGLALRHGGS